ncbi:hypothetical protein AB0M45_05450 [Nocardia sp. NPDC051787]|uniref:hypothetical protein n=1 Tax=Nocardia sp. NPDC051787 TaxID=3155415 RepID=UPI0034396AC5
MAASVGILDVTLTSATASASINAPTATFGSRTHRQRHHQIGESVCEDVRDAALDENAVGGGAVPRGAGRWRNVRGPPSGSRGLILLSGTTATAGDR